MGSSEDKGKGYHGMSKLGGFETRVQILLNCIKVKRSMILHLHCRELLKQDFVRHEFNCYFPEHYGSVVPSIAERSIRGELCCFGESDCVGRSMSGGEFIIGKCNNNHNNNNNDDDYDKHNRCRIGGEGSVERAVVDTELDVGKVHVDRRKVDR